VKHPHKIYDLRRESEARRRASTLKSRHVRRRQRRGRRRRERGRAGGRLRGVERRPLRLRRAAGVATAGDSGEDGKGGKDGETRRPRHSAWDSCRKSPKQSAEGGDELAQVAEKLTLLLLSNERSEAARARERQLALEQMTESLDSAGAAPSLARWLCDLPRHSVKSLDKIDKKHPRILLKPEALLQGNPHGEDHHESWRQ
jgi:hypothetical protein